MQKFLLISCNLLFRFSYHTMMRKFLAIVLLSYFAAYYYLHITFWNKPNNTRQTENTAAINPKAEESQTRAHRSAGKTYTYFKKSQKLNSLSEQ